MVKIKQINGPRYDASSDRELEEFIYQVIESGGEIIDVETKYYENGKNSRLRGKGSIQASNLPFVSFTVFYKE